MPRLLAPRDGLLNGERVVVAACRGSCGVMISIRTRGSTLIPSSYNAMLDGPRSYPANTYLDAPIAGAEENLSYANCAPFSFKKLSNSASFS